MRLLSLFTGIGGMDLGLERAGFEVVGMCEMDAFCRRVLARWWPGAPVFEDVRSVTGVSVREACGPIDAVCGGFPCQDISTAGKGAGIDGERSGLWREMHRVIRETEPRWVIAENVPALRARGADRVLDDLEASGYACWPVVVGARHVGAPHRRDRVFIV
ncbi:MAG: DNA cytosine methyltransferase, partial [Phycisphaerales bacterium JB064]